MKQFFQVNCTFATSIEFIVVTRSFIINANGEFIWQLGLDVAPGASGQIAQLSTGSFRPYCYAKFKAFKSP
jgi:hypothetical protein